MSFLAKNYNRKKIAFIKGKGSFLYSTKGEKYLDFVQGIAVNSLGHAHPKLIKTLNLQSKKIWHVSNAFIIPEGERLAKKIVQNTFADYVMFQNSGAEATEAAIKVARRYFYSIGIPNKNRILCIKNSFHGRTIAAIHASGSKKMIEGFGELFRQISFAKIGTSSIQSRALAALINNTYVFCLPGSKGACKDGWDEILQYQLDSRHQPCNFIDIMPRLSEK